MTAVGRLLVSAGSYDYILIIDLNICGADGDTQRRQPNAMFSATRSPAHTHTYAMPGRAGPGRPSANPKTHLNRFCLRNKKDTPHLVLMLFG